MIMAVDAFDSFNSFGTGWEERADFVDAFAEVVNGLLTSRWDAAGLVHVGVSEIKSAVPADVFATWDEYITAAVCKYESYGWKVQVTETSLFFSRPDEVTAS